MPDARIRIESGRSSEGLSLRIVDAVSGETLASFRLDTVQAWHIMGGGIGTVDGKVSGHLDRVGKRMEHESVTYSRGSYSTDREVQLGAAEIRARADHPDWETYSARFSNDNRIIVVMRRWV